MTGLTQTSGFTGPAARPRPWRRPRVWLVAYCGVVCVLALGTFAEKTAVPIMPSRADDISASIAVVDRGGPPLLASDVPYEPGLDVSHLRPVGVTDDQGIYLYLPYLSKLTGERDPAVLMKWLFMGSFALLVFVLPLILYELFGSMLVAVAAPLIALWKFRYTQTLDLYWVQAWCMLLAIPGLVLAYVWWESHRRRAVALLVALMVAASYSTSVRIHSGLPILVGGLGIVLLAGARFRHSYRRLLRFWEIERWWYRPVVAAALVLAYLSIATFGFGAARAYRNHVIHQSGFGASWPTEHPFWHNAYIGLGYLPNKYAIEWNDAVSTDAVYRAKPDAGYLTKEYESTLRHLYGEITRDDFGFVVDNAWTKARTIVADAVSSFWLVLLLLPAAVFLGRFRRPMRVALLVALPAALFGALAPVLTIPSGNYELGWLGTWGALLILGLGWLWVTTQQFVRDVPPDLAPLRERPDPVALSALRERVRRAPAAWAALAGLVLLVFLAALARPDVPPSSAGLYASEPPSFVATSRLDEQALRSWEFPGSLPAGWTAAPGAFVEPDAGGTANAGLYVRSTMTTADDQVVGPALTLNAGKYELVTLGRSVAGGFRITVRKADGSTIGSTGYSAFQPEQLTEAMSLRFELPSRMPVRVTMSNWSSFPTASSWIVWKMKLLPAAP